ncbi:hypothetical protein Tco_0759577, partial [Tanacetum coccineum]
VESTDVLAPTPLRSVPSATVEPPRLDATSVGAAHIPHSDGVAVSVATMSPKDSELLGKLEEAGDAAYQVGSLEQSRCHSI